MLEIRFQKQGEDVFYFRTEKPLLRIGRSRECDFVIEDSSLSRVHCQLSFKDGNWFIEDLSKNGILVDGEQKLPARARAEFNRSYKMGRLFSLQLSPRFKTKTAEDRTVLISDRPTQLLSLDVEGGKVILGRALVAGIDQAGNKFRRFLESAGLTIGSHESNDLVFASDSISQFHSRIDFADGHFLISDLNSTNGTFLDGVGILRARLPSGSKIGIGPFELQFSLETEEKEIKTNIADLFLGMVSKNKEMKKVFSLIETVSVTDAPVHIHGETGTGKELIAKAVHTLSRRYQGQFVALNCAALPKELVETELFGHEKGAFTGAIAARTGAFALAHLGTLFLDEIGELDLALQAKILRALETGEIRPLGSNKSMHSSVRLITATHKDLLTEVREGRFREDLFYRLHVVPVSLPPLRKRLDDLDILVPHLLQELNLQLEIEADALASLKTYRFPGNIRELKNILQRAAVQFDMAADASSKKAERILKVKHFQFLDEIEFVRSPLSAEKIKERDEIDRLLRVFNYNQSDVARELGVPISTLHDRVKKYGLQRS